MKDQKTSRLPGQAPFKRRGHIALTLLGVLIAVGILPLATMSWKLIHHNRESLMRGQQETQLLLASSKAKEVDLAVEGVGSQLLRVAQTLGAAVRRSGNIPRDEIRQALNEVTDQRISYVRYSYFEGQEVRFVSAGTPVDHLEPLFGATLQRIAENLSRNQGAAKPVETILSDPFLTRTDGPKAMIAMAAPVMIGGSFRGVLSALVDFDSIWEAVTYPNFTGHLVFAADGQGSVFASTDPEQIRPGHDVRRSPLVDRFLSQQGRATRESMQFDLDLRGETGRYIGAFDQTGQGWGIFVQAPAESVYWSVREMERSTVRWGLVLLGVAVLVALILARNLSNPINRLAAASRALARGDLTTRVEVRSRSEVGELAHSFNSMASEIEEHVRRLKQAFEENNELFLGTIRALAQAIDAKDPYTRGHSVRVNRYSVIIARQLGLPEAEIRDIHVSSLLHDVGKIGIDDAILKKNGRLTDEEFEIIKTHPVLGATIMAPIRQMQNIIPGLHYHHERCNGSGYPDGLTREEIPLMARIIAVADSFDAITTTRPYQEHMPFDKAVARINELKGDHLDSKVVEAFNRACVAGQIRLESERIAEQATIPAPPPSNPAPIDATLDDALLIPVEPGRA